MLLIQAKRGKKVLKREWLPLPEAGFLNKMTEQKKPALTQLGVEVGKIECNDAKGFSFCALFWRWSGLLLQYFKILRIL